MLTLLPLVLLLDLILHINLSLSFVVAAIDCIYRTLSIKIPEKTDYHEIAAYHLTTSLYLF